MKKILVLILAATVAALWAGAAFAAISGTAHDVTGVQGGVCAACHIPHASGGDRLWVKNPVSGAAPAEYGAKAVSPLCGYCHYPNMGGNTGPSWSGSNVYGDASHGHATLMDEATATLPYGHEASGLPYMADAADGTIECTSCHNVHDDGNRPFLRLDANVLCGACHGERLHQDTAAGWQSYDLATAPPIGAWGASIGDTNPGSHPVGTDVVANLADSTSPTTIPAIMTVANVTTAEGWTLGGHLTGGATGGVSCVTCHAVHGIQYDSGAPGSGLDSFGADNSVPNDNMLAVYQAGGTILPLSRVVSNGNTGFDGLCEACHNGVALDAAYGAAATTNPNPGATAFGHPIDDMNVINPGDWVTGFPISWPSGAGYTASDSDPNVVCESCHAPHTYADRTRADLLSGNPTASQYILRNSRAGVCDDCHSSAPTGAEHHPIGATFYGDGATYLQNVVTGNGNTLSCATCHAGSGAHNWTGAGAVGLDPSWSPADNARYATYDVDMSKTCMDCHYSIETGSPQPGLSPVLSTGTAFSGEAGYEDHGTASHFIGAIDPRGAYGPAIGGDNASYWTSVAGGLGGAINPQVDDWSTQGGVAVGFSRFGGAGVGADTVVVCESCHELEPDKNNGTAGGHLLLGATFTEQANGAMARTTDQFCEGCHLPKGTHPLYNDIVTRTATNLSTDTTATWLVTPVSGPTMGSAAQGTMSCDSCHQVHDAPVASATFILDIAPTALDNTGQVTASPTTADYAASYVTPYDDKSALVNYQGFCNKCHQYQ